MCSDIASSQSQLKFEVASRTSKLRVTLKMPWYLSIYFFSQLKEKIMLTHTHLNLLMEILKEVTSDQSKPENWSRTKAWVSRSGLTTVFNNRCCLIISWERLTSKIDGKCGLLCLPLGWFSKWFVKLFLEDEKLRKLLPGFHSYLPYELGLAT